MSSSEKGKNSSSSNMINNNIDLTINQVLNQTQASNDQSISNDITRKSKNNKKRTTSLNLDDDNDKRSKLNITVEDFGETSRLVNKIFERLDLLEDECNRLNGANACLKSELKEIKNNYSKLTSKHSILFSKNYKY